MFRLKGNGTSFPFNFSQHTVLVRVPGGEVAKVAPHGLRSSVKYVPAVAVHKSPCLVWRVVGVAGDVRAAVDHQDTPAELGRYPLGEGRAGEPGSYDHPVKVPPTERRRGAAAIGPSIGSYRPEVSPAPVEARRLDSGPAWTIEIP